MAPSEKEQHEFCNLAKAYKFEQCIEHLREEPGLANCQPAGRWPVLHQAASSGNVAVVKQLLELRCDAEAKNREGQSATDVAKSEEVRQALLGEVPDDEEQPKQAGRGGLPTDAAAAAAAEAVLLAIPPERQHAFLDLAKAAKYKDVEDALKAQLTPALQAQLANCLPKPRVFRAIHQGAWWGHTQFVDVLLKFSADPTLQDTHGKSPLEVAKERKAEMSAKGELSNHTDVIKLLQDALDKIGGARLDPDSRAYETIEASMVQTWDHSAGPAPLIKEIWNVKNKDVLLNEKFESYVSSLGNAGQKTPLEDATWWNDGYMPGNLQESFYGLPTRKQAEDLAAAGFNSYAFKEGLVLTSSAEAVAVAKAGKEQIVGAVLVCNVARGKVEALDSGSAPGGALPSGHHSRYFKDTKATVVWKPEAVMPEYLILFEDMPSLAEQHAFLDLAKGGKWQGIRKALEEKTAGQSRRGPRFMLANCLPESRRFTALHQAAHAGSLEGVEILLNAKANPLMKSQDGETVLQVIEAAVAEGVGAKEDIMSLLRDALPRPIEQGSDLWTKIEKEFEDRFDKDGTDFQRPIVKAVYNVEQKHIVAFQKTYAEKIGEVSDSKVPDSTQPGNQQMRYHGTKMACDFEGHTCGQNGCTICSIIENGFSMRWAAKGSFFGDGIYSTTSSSTSLRYAKKGFHMHWSEGGSSGAGAVFLANVVCGRVQYLKGADYDADTAKRLPPEFHARMVDDAQTNKQYETLAMKFGAPMIPSKDECICFRDQSLAPKYLITFEKAPTYKDQNALLDQALEGLWDDVHTTLGAASPVERRYLLDCFGGCSSAYNYRPREKNLLHHAAEQNRKDQVKSLLDLRADPGLKTRVSLKTYQDIISS